MISVAKGKPTSPQQFTVRDEVCSLGVNGGGPEARRSMPTRLARRKLGEDRTVRLQLPDELV